MNTGTVKWFNPTKRFGFIQPDNGSQDTFVHMTAVEQAGLTTLEEGQKISYSIQEQNGKASAIDLKLVG